MINRIINGVRWRLRSRLGPGGKSRWSRYLDQRAAKRVLEAIIAKTNDVETVRWLDRPIWQYPLDAWVMQEMIGALKPELIVETGTCLGGSAYFFANIFDLMGSGEVMSIDIAPRGTMPHHRITYLQGSSTDPELVAQVRERIDALKAKTVLVILDSDHSESHVRNELEAYAPLIPIDSYIYVQDGCIDTLPSLRAGRPGPVPAVQSFLRDHPQFVRDTEVEFRYVMTAHPFGWLKRIAHG